jgi:flavin-dependent dehydrogenase
VLLDVAVIGASTAGLYAAEYLARAGQQVAVFEQQAELAPARRTYIITPHLQTIFPDVPPAHILHHSQIMAVETASEQLTVHFQTPDLIIERNALTHLLAQRAAQSGVTIHYAHCFQDVRPHPQGALLSLHDAAGRPVEVVARAIIGADGVFSTVASAAGLPLPPAVPIIQAEVDLPAGWNPTVSKVWFDTEETRFFYWLIPESPRRGVVGLAGDDPAVIRQLLQSFLRRHRLSPLAYQSAYVALYHPRLRPWGQVGNAPVLLVGDAAGQVKVTTVGGTVTGLWGARAAAQSLVAQTPYAQEMRPLQRELALHWLIRAVLERLDNRGYDRLVRHMTLPVRQVLSRRNRDEMARGFWQLACVQPRLLALPLRTLVRPSSNRNKRSKG